MMGDISMVADTESVFSPKVCFVGGGNMTNAIVSGMLRNDYDPRNIYIIDRNIEKCDFFSKKLGVHAQLTIDDVLAHVDVIVLAVKPQAFSAVLPEISNYVNKQVVVSIAAGIEIKTIELTLPNASIIRAMPNTPCAVNLGATGLFASSVCSTQDKKWAEAILSACSMCFWVENEPLISAVVALSGSGPAYFLYLMECMEKAAIDMGLSDEMARMLIKQTALGASALAQSDESPAELRAKITSAKGTTEQAILSFQKDQFEQVIFQGMRACYDRDKALSLELSSGLMPSNNTPNNTVK